LLSFDKEGLKTVYGEQSLTMEKLEVTKRVVRCRKTIQGSKQKGQNDRSTKQ